MAGRENGGSPGGRYLGIDYVMICYYRSMRIDVTDDDESIRTAGGTACRSNVDPTSIPQLRSGNSLSTGDMQRLKSRHSKSLTDLESVHLGDTDRATVQALYASLVETIGQEYENLLETQFLSSDSVLETAPSVCQQTKRSRTLPHRAPSFDSGRRDLYRKQEGSDDGLTGDLVDSPTGGDTGRSRAANSPFVVISGGEGYFDRKPTDDETNQAGELEPNIQIWQGCSRN